MPTPLTGSPVSPTTLTGNAPIDSLLDGYHWASSAISYSFINSSVPSTYAANYSDPTFWSATVAFNATQQQSTVDALNAWANVANINWVYSNDNGLYAGTVRMGFSKSFSWNGYVGETYLPSASVSGGDLWLDPFASDAINGSLSGTFLSSTFQKGGYAFYTLLHELGHALGLKHPFENSTDGGGASLAGTSNSVWDSRVYTLMSYTVDQNHPDAIGFSFNPTTPMLLDIAALQAVYGVNSNFNAGDTTYTFTDAGSQHYFQTIWDGGGSNTISYSGTHAAAVDLRSGYGSTIGNPVYEYTSTNASAYQVNNIWIADGTKIQSLDLSGCRASYSVIANDFGDTIYAGIGSGTITGGNGGDAIHVNAGNETIVCGTGIDNVFFSGNKSSYSINYTSGVFNVSSLLGVDSVSGAEYFNFSDGRVLSTAALSNTTNTLTVDSLHSAVNSTSQNDLITGLSMLDSVIYRGVLSNYSITISVANNAVVQDQVSTRDGTDSLVNIERLKFADTTVALDIGATQNAGAAYMLYKAAFNRAPDATGLGFWIQGLDNGANLVDGVSANFITSPEFGRLYGTSPSIDTFVNLLYQNVLHRTPDANGYAFWTAGLNATDNLHMRAQILEDFASSPENIAQVGTLIAHGIQYQAYVG